MVSSGCCASRVDRQRSADRCDEWSRNARDHMHRASSQQPMLCARRCAARHAEPPAWLTEPATASRRVRRSQSSGSGVAGGADSDQRNQPEQEQHREVTRVHEHRTATRQEMHCAGWQPQRLRRESAERLSSSAELPHDQPSQIRPCRRHKKVQWNIGNQVMPSPLFHRRWLKRKIASRAQRLAQRSARFLVSPFGGLAHSLRSQTH